MENFNLRNFQESNIHSKSLSYNYSQTCQQKKKESPSKSNRKIMINENKVFNYSNSSRDNSVIINNESNGNIVENSTLMTMVKSKQMSKEMQLSISTVK